LFYPDNDQFNHASVLILLSTLGRSLYLAPVWAGGKKQLLDLNLVVDQTVMMVDFYHGPRLILLGGPLRFFVCLVRAPLDQGAVSLCGCWRIG